MENKEKVQCRICHCGKCKIRCNKHGKKGKCEECGKIRMLGTIVEHGVAYHCCNSCLDNISKSRVEKVKNDVDLFLNDLKAKKAGSIDVAQSQAEENEICIEEPIGEMDSPATTD